MMMRRNLVHMDFESCMIKGLLIFQQYNGELGYVTTDRSICFEGCKYRTRIQDVVLGRQHWISHRSSTCTYMYTAIGSTVSKLCAMEKRSSIVNLGLDSQYAKKKGCSRMIHVSALLLQVRGSLQGSQIRKVL